MIIQLILIQVLIFTGLIFILRILFYRQLHMALNRLKRLHEENLKREDELKQEIEKAKEDREKILIKAKEEAAKLIAETKKSSERIVLDAQEQAHVKLKSFLNDGKIKLDIQEKELLEKYHQKAMDLSLEIFELAFTSQGKENLQHELVDELINEIRSIEKERFSVKTDRGKIITPFSLKEEERKKIRDILFDKTGATFILEEVLDASILAGLIIELGGLTLDGSLKNKVQKIISYHKDRTKQHSQV